nr:unnamed protein product [Callosobruchus analis]
MDLKYKYYCGFYILTAVFIVDGISVNESQARKCYVCGDEGDPPCKNFEMDKEMFSKQCNPSDQACLIKIEGRKRVRTCEKEKIEDCKIANGVKYCFCTTDLCNDNETRFSTPTDDEDILEGSGSENDSYFDRKSTNFYCNVFRKHATLSNFLTITIKLFDTVIMWFTISS